MSFSIDSLKDPSKTYEKPKAGNFSRESVESFAEGIAMKIGYKSGAHLYDIVENKLGAKLHFVEDLENGLNGATIIHDATNLDIAIPRKNGSFRANYTIAHELGHYFLHSQQGNTPIIAQDNQLPDKAEAEANWFAAAFLMPKQAFTEKWEECLGVSELVSRHFLVSPLATKIRAESLGLINE